MAASVSSDVPPGRAFTAAGLLSAPRRASGPGPTPTATIRVAPTVSATSHRCRFFIWLPPTGSNESEPPFRQPSARSAERAEGRPRSPDLLCQRVDQLSDIGHTEACHPVVTWAGVESPIASHNDVSEGRPALERIKQWVEERQRRLVRFAARLIGQ